MVYYDSATKEVVIMGGQIPAVGTYSIVVTGSVKSATGFVCSSFQFELSVPDSFETTDVQDDSCNQSNVKLEGLQTTYSYTCTSGELFFKVLTFTDSLGGGCLSEWQFPFEPEHEDPQITFNETTKSMTFFTARTDLTESSAVLKVIRSDNTLIQETKFNF